MNKITKLLFATLLASTPSLFTGAEVNKEAKPTSSNALMSDGVLNAVFELTVRWDGMQKKCEEDINMFKAKSAEPTMRMPLRRDKAIKSLSGLKAVQRTIHRLLIELHQPSNALQQKGLATGLSKELEQKGLATGLSKELKQKDLTLLVLSYLLPTDDLQSLLAKIDVDVKRLDDAAGSEIANAATARLTQEITSTPSLFTGPEVNKEAKPTSSNALMSDGVLNAVFELTVRWDGMQEKCEEDINMFKGKSVWPTMRTPPCPDEAIKSLSRLKAVQRTIHRLLIELHQPSNALQQKGLATGLSKELKQKDLTLLVLSYLLPTDDLQSLLAKIDVDVKRLDDAAGSEIANAATARLTQETSTSSHDGISADALANLSDELGSCTTFLELDQQWYYMKEKVEHAMYEFLYAKIHSGFNVDRDLLRKNIVESLLSLQHAQTLMPNLLEKLGQPFDKDSQTLLAEMNEDVKSYKASAKHYGITPQ